MELNNRPRKSLDGRTPYEANTELDATIDPLRCGNRYKPGVVRGSKFNWC
jgi:hypothetical protein